MKWFVRGILALVVLAVLAVGAAFAALMMLDPNDYKDRIAAGVKESTGRELVIAGDIEATLFPVLGFKVSGVQLGNPPGFAAEDFLNVDMAQAGVKIMPLLDKHVELTKIVLNKPSVHIIKKANGETNLAFGSGKKEATVKGEGGANVDLQADMIEITDAKVIYEDQATGKTTVIDPLSLSMPGFAPGKSSAMTLQMVMKAAESQVKVDATSQATAKPESGEFSLSGVKADVEMTAPAFKDAVKIALSGAGSINTKTQDMALDASDIKMSWQGTDISGKAGVKGKFSAPSVTFDLSSPSVDIDALMAGMGGKKENNPDKPLIPVDLLRMIDLAGDANVQKLVFAGMVLENVQAKVSAKGGNLAISPVTADFYQGKIDAAVTVDARSAVPVIGLRNTAAGIAVGELLKTKMGDDYITGQAGGSYDLTLRGNTMNELRRSAAGNVNFKFGEGYINKWQLSRLLNQAIAFFETGQITQDVPDKVYFTALSGTFTGQNGVFTNNDLSMSGPKVHALGDGVVNIAAQTVDYRVRAGLGSEPSASAKHIPIKISGPLAKPSYSLDTQALVTDTVKEKLQEKILDKIGGGSAEGDSVGESKASPAEEAGQQLLKGLFGQ